MSVLVALQGAANARTVGDTLAGAGGAQLPLLLGGGTGGGISESVSVRKDVVRSASDSVATISETTSRTLGATRTTSASLATLSEAVSRIVGALRTVADSISAITEAVVGIKSGGSQNYTASVSDTLAGSGGAQLPLLLGGGAGTSGISESVSTQTGVHRTAGDSVGTISETLGEDAVEIRGTADSLPTLAESASRQAAYGRTASATVGAITEAVAGVVTPSGPTNYFRTAGDSISAITESVAWPAPSAGVEPAGGLRFVMDEPVRRPRHLVRTAADDIYYIVEYIDEVHFEDDDWLRDPVLLDLVLA